MSVPGEYFGAWDQCSLKYKSDGGPAYRDQVEAAFLQRYPNVDRTLLHEIWLGNVAHCVAYIEKYLLATPQCRSPIQAELFLLLENDHYPFCVETVKSAMEQIRQKINNQSLYVPFFEKIIATSATVPRTPITLSNVPINPILLSPLPLPAPSVVNPPLSTSHGILPALRSLPTAPNPANFGQPTPFYSPLQSASTSGTQSTQTPATVVPLAPIRTNSQNASNFAATKLLSSNPKLAIPTPPVSTTTSPTASLSSATSSTSSSNGGATVATDRALDDWITKIAGIDINASSSSPVTKRLCKNEARGHYYCRSWNLRFLATCQDYHRFTPNIRQLNPTVKPALVNLKANSPEYITTSKEFIGAWKLSGAKPVITKIELIKAPYLEELFKPMELELEKKLVSTGRRTLYHGTHEANLPRVLTHGLSPPSDYEVSPNCKAWGHIKMASSPCTLECQECAGQNAVRHKWNKCHMFGLGIYFADQSSKSDRYVSRPDGAPVEKERKMLVVEVLLGSCYEIQELKTPDQLHDYVAAPDGYDSIMAIGTSTAKQGLQVLNNECTYSL